MLKKVFKNEITPRGSLKIMISLCLYEPIETRQKPKTIPLFSNYYRVKQCSKHTLTRQLLVVLKPTSYSHLEGNQTFDAGLGKFFVWNCLWLQFQLILRNNFHTEYMYHHFIGWEWSCCITCSLFLRSWVHSKINCNHLALIILWRISKICLWIYSTKVQARYSTTYHNDRFFYVEKQAQCYKLLFFTLW